jgi:hypothetical protein
VFIPILARCVAGSLYGAVANEMFIAASMGDNLTVESLISGVVGGCISGVLPAGVQYMATLVKRPLVSAIAAAIIWLSRP